MLVAEHAAPARWRLHALADLHWRRWNEDWAVFDVGSGQTHRFDTFSALAVLLLEESGGLHVDDLTARISQQLGVVEGPELLQPLAEVLHRLSTLGLIESVP